MQPLDQSIRTAFRNPDPRRRAQGVKLLVRSDHPTAPELLRRVAATDPHPQVREIAGKGLLHLRKQGVAVDDPPQIKPHERFRSTAFERDYTEALGLLTTREFEAFIERSDDAAPLQDVDEDAFHAGTRRQPERDGYAYDDDDAYDDPDDDPDDDAYDDPDDDAADAADEYGVSLGSLVYDERSYGSNRSQGAEIEDDYAAFMSGQYLLEDGALLRAIPYVESTGDRKRKKTQTTRSIDDDFDNFLGEA